VSRHAACGAASHALPVVMAGSRVPWNFGGAPDDHQAAVIGADMVSAPSQLALDAPVSPPLFGKRHDQETGRRRGTPAFKVMPERDNRVERCRP
jgi:hypothetical protein